MEENNNKSGNLGQSSNSNGNAMGGYMTTHVAPYPYTSSFAQPNYLADGEHARFVAAAKVNEEIAERSKKEISAFKANITEEFNKIKLSINPLLSSLSQSIHNSLPTFTFDQPDTRPATIPGQVQVFFNECNVSFLDKMNATENEILEKFNKIQQADNINKDSDQIVDLAQTRDEIFLQAIEDLERQKQVIDQKIEATDDEKKKKELRLVKTAFDSRAKKFTDVFQSSLYGKKEPLEDFIELTHNKIKSAYEQRSRYKKQRSFSSKVKVFFGHILPFSKTREQDILKRQYKILLKKSEILQSCMSEYKKQWGDHCKKSLSERAEDNEELKQSKSELMFANKDLMYEINLFTEITKDLSKISTGLENDNLGKDFFSVINNIVTTTNEERKKAGGKICKSLQLWKFIADQVDPIYSATSTSYEKKAEIEKIVDLSEFKDFAPTKNIKDYVKKHMVVSYKEQLDTVGAIKMTALKNVIEKIADANKKSLPTNNLSKNEIEKNIQGIIDNIKSTMQTVKNKLDQVTLSQDKIIAIQAISTDLQNIYDNISNTTHQLSYSKSTRQESMNALYGYMLAYVLDRQKIKISPECLGLSSESQRNYINERIVDITDGAIANIEDFVNYMYHVQNNVQNNIGNEQAKKDYERFQKSKERLALKDKENEEKYKQYQAYEKNIADAITMQMNQQSEHLNQLTIDARSEVERANATERNFLDMSSKSFARTENTRRTKSVGKIDMTVLSDANIILSDVENKIQSFYEHNNNQGHNENNNNIKTLLQLYHSVVELKTFCSNGDNRKVEELNQHTANCINNLNNIRECHFYNDQDKVNNYILKPIYAVLSSLQNAISNAKSERSTRTNMMAY